MKSLPRIINLFCAILLSIFITNCQTTRVNVKVQKPPEVNLPNIKRIAVLDFHTLQGPRQTGMLLTEDLISQLSSNNFYEIIERGRLQQIIGELRFSQSGMVSPRHRQRLKRLLSVDAIILGSVTRCDCKDSGRWTTREKYHNKRVYRVKVYEATRTANFAANFRIVDVESGRILAARQNEDTQNSSAYHENIYNAQNQLRDCATMLEYARGMVIKKFIRQISPHEVFETRTIYNGQSDEMATAAEYFRANLLNEATNLWQQVARTRNHPDAHCAYHNLAVVYEMNNDFPSAEQYLRQAYQLSQDIDFKSHCQQQIAKLKTRQGEVRRLDRITGTPSTPKTPGLGPSSIGDSQSSEQLKRLLPDIILGEKIITRSIKPELSITNLETSCEYRFATFAVRIFEFNSNRAARHFLQNAKETPGSRFLYRSYVWTKLPPSLAYQYGRERIIVIYPDDSKQSTAFQIVKELQRHKK